MVESYKPASVRLERWSVCPPRPHADHSSTASPPCPAKVLQNSFISPPGSLSEVSVLCPAPAKVLAISLHLVVLCLMFVYFILPRQQFLSQLSTWCSLSNVSALHPAPAKVLIKLYLLACLPRFQGCHSSRGRPLPLTARQIHGKKKKKRTKPVAAVHITFSLVERAEVEDRYRSNQQVSTEGLKR